MTSLSSEFVDHAALIDILNNLYELRYNFMAIEYQSPNAYVDIRIALMLFRPTDAQISL